MPPSNLLKRKNPCGFDRFAVAGSTLSYDDAGNMITDDQGNHLIYDAWNRLVLVNDDDNILIRAYTYDGMGRRITSYDGTDTVTYYFSGSQMIEAYDGSAR